MIRYSCFARIVMSRTRSNIGYCHDWEEAEKVFRTMLRAMRRHDRRRFRDIFSNMRVSR